MDKERQRRGWENYNDGTRFELRVLYKLRKRTHLSVRSAGSRTPIDIISYRRGSVWWVVCKRNGYIPPKERAELEKLRSAIPLHPEWGRVQIKLAYLGKGRRIRFKDI